MEETCLTSKHHHMRWQAGSGPDRLATDPTRPMHTYIFCNIAEHPQSDRRAGNLVRLCHREGQWMANGWTFPRQDEQSLVVSILQLQPSCRSRKTRRADS